MVTQQSAYETITLNGCYDPLFTLGGGTATGFTALAALYNRYIVTRTTVVMRIRNDSPAVIGNDIVAFIMELPSTQTNMVGTLVSADVQEARRTTTCVIPFNNTFGYREISRTIDILQLEALPSLWADYANLSGAPNANPARSPVALCGCLRPAGMTTGCTAEAMILVEFTVTFYQPTQFTVV
jgi:hypothetical protein